MIAKRHAIADASPVTAFMDVNWTANCHRLPKSSAIRFSVRFADMMREFLLRLPVTKLVPASTDWARDPLATYAAPAFTDRHAGRYSVVS